MPLIAWLVAAAWSAEPAYYEGEVDRALALLLRDAEIPSQALRPAPLWFGEQLEVVGGLDATRCQTSVSGMTFADALADAIRWAGSDALDAASDVLRTALDALPCLDVPVRSWEAATAHDLASALAIARGPDRDAAVQHARQALAYDPDHAFVYQVDPYVLSVLLAPHPAPSTLWLPPGGHEGQVLVDGRPVGGTSVSLSPGRHLVQALGRRVTTLAVDVPVEPAQAVLLTADARADLLDLERPGDRAWLEGALTRWGPMDRPAWVVVQDRVWRTDAGSWSRYDRRPPRSVRPALLTVLGVATAGGIAGSAVGWSRYEELGRCGTPGASDRCLPYVDATSGLIIDRPGWEQARVEASALGIAFTSATLVAGGALAWVATRAQSPHAVQVALSGSPRGASVAVSGTWGPR